MRGAPAVALCAAALLAGCGSGGTASGPAGSRAPSIPLATFNCGEWKASRADIRQTVVDELRNFYGSPVAGRGQIQGYGTVLTDEQAHRLFDSWCAQSFAGHFTLYKLYARAAAFGGSAP